MTSRKVPSARSLSTAPVLTRWHFHSLSSVTSTDSFEATHHDRIIAAYVQTCASDAPLSMQTFSEKCRAKRHDDNRHTAAPASQPLLTSGTVAPLSRGPRRVPGWWGRLFGAASGEIREVAVQPPSMRDEGTWVFLSAVFVLVCVAYVVAFERFGVAVRAGTPPSTDVLPYQVLFRDLPSSTQRIFRAMQEGALEAFSRARDRRHVAGGRGARRRPDSAHSPPTCSTRRACAGVSGGAACSRSTSGSRR